MYQHSHGLKVPQKAELMTGIVNLFPRILKCPNSLNKAIENINS